MVKKENHRNTEVRKLGKIKLEKLKSINQLNFRASVVKFVFLCFRGYFVFPCSRG